MAVWVIRSLMFFSKSSIRCQFTCLLTVHVQTPYLSHVIDSANDLIGHVLESVLSLLQHSLDLKYILLLSNLVTISLKEEESDLLISHTKDE